MTPEGQATNVPRMKPLPKQGEIWKWFGYGEAIAHYLILEEPVKVKQGYTNALLDIKVMELESGVVEDCEEYEWFPEHWEKVA